MLKFYNVRDSICTYYSQAGPAHNVILAFQSSLKNKTPAFEAHILTNIHLLSHE